MNFTRKPWSVVILAFIQCLAPLNDILFNAYIYKMSPWKFFLYDIHQSTWIQLFLANFVGPLAGIAIFKVRWWSYPVFLSCVAWIGVSNFLSWKHNPTLVSLPVLLTCYILNIILVSYFLIPQIRKMYFNPRVRWWESKPRYQLVIPSTVIAKEKSIESTLVNISEGGALIETSAELANRDPIWVNFNIFSQQYSLNAEVVYQVKKPPGSGSKPAVASQVYAYGVQFVSTPEQRKRIIKTIRAFELISLERRPLRESNLKSFISWLKIPLNWIKNSNTDSSVIKS